MTASRKALLSLALLGLFGVVPAAAQPNPTFGVLSGVVPKATFTTVTVGLIPAASATDVACISGSASKTIKVTRISVSGSAGTLVTVPISLVRRTSLNTGSGPPNTQNWALNVQGMDTTTATNSAAVQSWNTTSGNPTIVDTTPLLIRGGNVTFPTTGTTVAGPNLVWEFGNAGIGQNNQPTIRNGQTTQTICVNLGTVSVSSGVLQIGIEWTEE